MLSLAPSVNVQHNDQLYTANVSAGLFASRFINNPQFSFVGVNGSVFLGLDNLVKRLSPRLSLTLMDSVSYTPQQPAFLVPQGDEQTPQGVDFRGIQAARANALTNMGSASGGFTFTPLVSLTASYTNMLSRFGTPISQPGVGGFLDTTSESVSVGPRFTLSATDTVSGGYTYTKSTFDAGAPGVQANNFQTDGGYVSWSHVFTANLSGNLSGNYSYIKPFNVGVYGGQAGLSYRVLATTSASLNFSRQVMPSFFVAGLPLVSNVVSLQVGHTIMPKLSGSLGLSYARSESEGTPTAGQGDLVFESYAASTSLSYALTQYASASASYSYGHFNQTFSGLESRFDMHTISLSLMGRWPYKWS